MLVGLPSKDIAKHWETFREILRASIPTSPSVLPDRAQRWLYAALTGRLQCWLGFDPDDPSGDFYIGAVTRLSVDDLTGEKSLLIYAIGAFKKAPRSVRNADWAMLKKVAKDWGCTYMSCYVYSDTVFNAIEKLNGGGLKKVYYTLIPTEGGAA